MVTPCTFKRQTHQNESRWSPLVSQRRVLPAVSQAIATLLFVFIEPQRQLYSLKPVSLVDRGYLPGLLLYPDCSQKV